MSKTLNTSITCSPTMSSVATIKGVDPEVWKKFKSEAARHGATMGEFLHALIRKHISEEVMTREEAFRVMDDLRAKSGSWSGSQEVFKWRKKRVF